MQLAKRFTYDFLVDSDQNIVKEDKDEKSCLYTKNVEQSRGFVLIMMASSSVLVLKKEILPGRNHLSTMHLILLLKFMPNGNTTDTNKPING